MSIVDSLSQVLGYTGSAFVGGWMGFLLAKSLYSKPVGSNSWEVPYLWPSVALVFGGSLTGIVSFKWLLTTH